MNRLFISVLCVLFVGVLYGQQKDIDKAIQNGKNSMGYYTAYPKKLYAEKYNKWLKDNTKYTVLSIKTDSYAEFGETVNIVREIHFLVVGDEAAYNNAIESKHKNELISTAKTLRQRIAVRKVYADYRISDISEKQLADMLAQNNFGELENFIATFPEYKTNSSIKNEYLSRVSPNATTLKRFIDVFNDFNVAENYVYQGASGWKLSTIRELIPVLEKSTIKTNRIIDVADKRILSSNLQEIINQCVEFYGNKYFSKQNFNDYMTSKATLTILFKEFDSYSALLQIRPQIKEEVTKEYIEKKYAKGINAWQELVADFPERRSELIAYTRKWLNQCGGYYSTKFSGDIQSNISSAENCISSLNNYINSGVPDVEGQKLASQYKNDAYSAIGKYRSDLSKAEAYENNLKYNIRNIYNNFENIDRLPLPNYSVQRNWYEEGNILGCDRYKIVIRISSDLIFISRCKNENQYEASSTGTLAFGNSFDEVVKKHMLKANGLFRSNSNQSLGCWQCFGKADDVYFAESIINQYQKYGVNQWWKIKY